MVFVITDSNWETLSTISSSIFVCFVSLIVSDDVGSLALDEAAATASSRPSSFEPLAVAVDVDAADNSNLLSSIFD